MSEEQQAAGQSSTADVTSRRQSPVPATQTQPGYSSSPTSGSSPESDKFPRRKLERPRKRRRESEEDLQSPPLAASAPSSGLSTSSSGVLEAAAPKPLYLNGTGLGSNDLRLCGGNSFGNGDIRLSNTELRLHSGLSNGLSTGSEFRFNNSAELLPPLAPLPFRQDLLPYAAGFKAVERYAGYGAGYQSSLPWEAPRESVIRAAGGAKYSAAPQYELPGLAAYTAGPEGGLQHAGVPFSQYLPPYLARPEHF